MNQVVVLLRRHLVESKWLLGLLTVGFFGLAILTAWLTVRFERLIDLGELGPAVRRFGFLRGLGGPEMDYSTTALEVCWWNHPAIVMGVLAWAISRGSGSVSGEIERGTIDVTLSRPVSRSSYLTSQVAFALLGLLLMAGSLILGNQVARLFYTLKAPPSVLTMMRPGLSLVALGMAVYGYTLPFSTLDVVRWRPALISNAITLTGLVALSLASQFPDYQTLLQNSSVFQYYAPVTTAMKGAPLGTNATTLTAVFAAGVGLSFFLFLKRDLPSNS